MSANNMCHLKKIAALIDRHDKFLIASHIIPDGDSIGSSLALGIALKKLGKKVDIFSPEPVPRIYTFLPNHYLIKTSLDGLPSGLTVIILDCTGIDRVEPLGRELNVNQGIKIINIDHHVTNQYFADYNYVDPHASATGEIIFDLLKELGLTVDYDIALCLYTAILTDTGSFKFENTTPNSLQKAADLLRKGVQPAIVAQKVFDERPLSSLLLLKEALGTLTLEYDGKIAMMFIDEAMLERSGALAEELDGLINYAKNIIGVEVGILFRSLSNREIKVGFRSKNIDVGKIASHFAGGGHPRAAGCRIKGELNEVKEKILGVTIKTLEHFYQQAE